MAAAMASAIVVPATSNSPSIKLPLPQNPSNQNATSNLQSLANQQFQPYYLRPAYRFKTNNQPFIDISMPDGPGRRLRRNVANIRRHIDYIANVLIHNKDRLWQYGHRDRIAAQPDFLYQNYVLPPHCVQEKPIDCVLTKFVRAAMNKVKCPIYSICWSPEGRRLITGASTGEFTLWNGTAFNFETILQAHDSAIRGLKWSHNDQWLASADHDGFVKYWQPNMNNVHMFQAHKDEPIRSISFAPTDMKLVTGSDDATARVWDFARCIEERVLRGHGSDVRCVDWHPQKGLICTGSRDSQQPVKLWDPNNGQCLSTLHDHKNSVMSVQWNKNGNWLITGSKDHLIKLYDIRMMREIRTYRGHKKEVTALSWHPVHEGLFASGGGDGSLAYWLANGEKELGYLDHAHDQAIWTLEWHPLGHILASGSNDNNTKFWARNRPGDTHDDVFGMSSLSGVAIMAYNANKKKEGGDETLNLPFIPGMGLDDDVFQGLQNRDTGNLVGGPKPGVGSISGSLLVPEDPNARHQSLNIGAKRTLIKQPPPKKAQRQFERMWNVAKPAGGDIENEAPDESQFRKPKASLLGPPPPSMLVAGSKQSEHLRSPSPPMMGNNHENGAPLLRDYIRQDRSKLHNMQHLSVSEGLQSPSDSNSHQISSNNVQRWASSASASATIFQHDAAGFLPPTSNLFSRCPQSSFSEPNRLIWPPNVMPNQQNTDIDYRTNQASVHTMPQQNVTLSGDVDLRHVSTDFDQLQAWRPTTSTSILSTAPSHDEPPMQQDKPRIHDPRVRRNRDDPRELKRRGQMELNFEKEVNSRDEYFGRSDKGHSVVRDPRQRPPRSQEMDDFRVDGPTPLRCWVPDTESDDRFRGNQTGYQNSFPEQKEWPTRNANSRSYNRDRSPFGHSHERGRNRGWGRRAQH